MRKCGRGFRGRKGLDRKLERTEGTNMQDKTYKLIELVGVSTTSIEEAVQNAVSRANQTLKNLDWFEVVEARGLIQDGKVNQFQVKLKVGFRLLG
jgi:hypothetical protein